jgi:hypothetical protein
VGDAVTTNRPLLLDKLHVILHRAFVEARNLAMAQRCQQLADLADTFEVLPLLISAWEDDSLECVRSGLENYHSKYRGCSYDYLSILDMDEDSFRKLYDPKSLALDPSWIQS